MILHAKKHIFLLLFIFAIFSLFAQARTSFRPLEVGEHWSRRVVTEENNAKRFYYRPYRFESMQLLTPNVSEIELRTVMTQRANSIDIIVRIGTQEQRHTLRVVRNDDYFYYAENIRITLPTNTAEISVRTRNPHAYFRHYGIRHRQLRPRTYALTPTVYLNTHTLSSERTNSEYFSGTDERPITYIADADGSIHFFVRSIREGRLGSTIDIFINDTLHQTTILPNKTSGDYRIGERRVSTGTRIELSNIKKGDKITIVPKTWHEIITRLFLTTKEVF